MVMNRPHTPGAGLFVAPLDVPLMHLSDIDQLGVGLCTNHVIVLATKPNHQDKVARGTTTQAILHNMIGEL
jgi:hypothetical protein